MEQSPSLEANSFSTSQEIPPYCMQPEGSLPHSQLPAPFLIPSQLNPVHAPIPLLKDPSQYYPPSTPGSLRPRNLKTIKCFGDVSVDRKVILKQSQRNGVERFGVD